MSAHTPGVRLCTECRWRRSIREEGDNSPCGQVWNKPLNEARRECGGQLWEPDFSRAAIARATLQDGGGE